MSQSQIDKQIELIARHEQEFLAQRTSWEKLGDRIATFVGSLSFVCMHVTLFLAWMGWNLHPGRRQFDPPPFSLLATMVALEGILLASFILMRQARISRRSEERDHLMLQVLLLTEKELTAVLSIDREIASRMGLQKTADHPELQELSQETSIEDVAQTIKENLPSVE